MLYLALRHDHRGFPRNFTCFVVLRYTPPGVSFSCTGLSPSMVVLSRIVPLTKQQSVVIKDRCTLQPPVPCGSGFGLFRVRSPLLTESLLLSFPRLTKMFQFSRYPLRLDRSNLGLTRLGFPIRTSSDQSLLASSPRLFAGCDVLHRQHVPRHPPHTLTLQEMSASEKISENIHN